MEFVCAEALSELQGRKIESPVLITHGTLEYFCPAELKIFFENVAAIAPRACFIICEPIASDLKAAVSSQPRGHLAYSHPYGAMLTATGYTVAACEFVESANREPSTVMNILLAYGPEGMPLTNSRLVQVVGN